MYHTFFLFSYEKSYYEGGRAEKSQKLSYVINKYPQFLCIPPPRCWYTSFLQQCQTLSASDYSVDNLACLQAGWNLVWRNKRFLCPHTDDEVFLNGSRFDPCSSISVSDLSSILSNSSYASARVENSLFLMQLSFSHLSEGTDSSSSDNFATRCFFGQWSVPFTSHLLGTTLKQASPPSMVWTILNGILRTEQLFKRYVLLKNMACATWCSVKFTFLSI